MTELEAYVRAEGRDKQVQQVQDRINDLGIQYIYYQFISVTGRVVGKGIPADHWEATANRGFQLVYDTKVPFGLLLKEAADQGLVLIHNPRTGAEDDLFLGQSTGR